MKSSILIVSYLWRDTWSRWLEQPSSFLARLFVGLVLALVATAILVAFQLLERSIQERLEKFGLNTVVVRHFVTRSSAELLLHEALPARLKPLEELGSTLRIQQLYPRAGGDYKQNVMAYTYMPEDVRLLEDVLDEDPLVYLTGEVPEGVPVRFDLSGRMGQAVAKGMPEFLQPLGYDTLLLLPKGWSPESERLGYVDTTLFVREVRGLPIPRLVEGIKGLFATEGLSAPQVQSAAGMLGELEELQARQGYWRRALAGVLGVTVALVFGAIAVLEFRQNLYIGALLRSLGAPGVFLYLRQWVENFMIINAATALAVVGLWWLHNGVFSTLGFSSTILEMAGENPYLSANIGLIFLWVNVGAFLSSLPVAWGLRRPVGAILN